MPSTISQQNTNVFLQALKGVNIAFQEILRSFVDEFTNLLPRNN